MSTLEEILGYCTEENHYGALMLTGQWGCGKTYLIEHDLPKALNEKYIVMRLSLFGISSIEDIHKKVKQSYFECILKNPESYLESFSGSNENKPYRLVKSLAKKASEKAGKNTKKVSVLAFLRDLAKTVPAFDKLFSINLSDYIEVENKVGSKTVILAFDDLERSCLDEKDVLGCINEYCENRKFKTIIIANEERMQESSDESRKDDEHDKANTYGSAISYMEIKEKIVNRTVKHKPDYKGIIAGILSRYEDSDGNYKKFLFDQVAAITDVFTTGEIKNIRSLQCAIQDFNRVYPILKEHNEFSEEIVNKYLLSFIAFVFCSKKGIIELSERYGFVLADAKVKEMYPLHYRESYMLYSIKNWIMIGEWNESDVLSEIAQIIKSMKKLEPEEIVRGNLLISLDEQVIETGFPIVIQAAYDGKLTIDEYITLIRNIAWARRVSLELPVDIDMNRIISRVAMCLRSVEDSDEPDSRVRSMISEDEEKLLSDGEKEVYNSVCRFRDENRKMFAQNRRLYLTALCEKDIAGIYQCKDKRFRLFDKEMANAASECYSYLSNLDRQDFNHLFKVMCENSYASQDLLITESIPAFEYLKKRLEESRDEDIINKQQIKAAIGIMLIQSVEKTIENLRSLATS